MTNTLRDKGIAFGVEQVVFGCFTDQTLAEHHGQQDCFLPVSIAIGVDDASQPTTPQSIPKGSDAMNEATILWLRVSFLLVALVALGVFVMPILMRKLSTPARSMHSGKAALDRRLRMMDEVQIPGESEDLQSKAALAQQRRQQRIKQLGALPAGKTAEMVRTMLRKR